MATDPEVEAMGKIAEALSKLEDPDALARILRWASGKYLRTGSDSSDAPVSAEGAPDPVAREDGVGPRASRWIRQTGLSHEQIEQVFHFDGSEASVIATIPGQYAADRVGNCYLLEGIRSLLTRDEPNFTDAAARELCRLAGCYDATNHSKRMKFANRITGDAKRGWTITGPGLNAAASLIKEIASTQEGS